MNGIGAISYNLSALFAVAKFSKEEKLYPSRDTVVPATRDPLL